MIIFATGTFSPIACVIAGTATVLVSQKRREWDQRELGLLFTLVFFAIAYYFDLVSIPQITLAG